MKKTETPGDEENHALKENCNACETLIEYREEKFTDSPNQAIPLETNNSQVAVDTVLFQEESLHPPIQPGDTPSSYGDNHNRESIESSIESLVLTDQTQVKMVCPEASNNSHDLFQSSEQPPPYTSAYTLPTAPQRNVNNTSDADAAPQSSASPLQDDSRQSVGADSVPQPERGRFFFFQLASHLCYHADCIILLFIQIVYSSDLYICSDLFLSPGTINLTQLIGDGAIVNVMLTGLVSGSVSNNPTMTSLHG